MPTPKLTNEIIAAAIDGYEFQKTRIDAKIAELRAMLSGGSAETAATPEPPTRKRKVSVAARRKMALAQKARWAKIKGVSEPAPAKAPKAKRKISKAGMARIIAAKKERWARVRAAKAQQEKAARKVARQKVAVKKAAVKAPRAKAAKKSTPVKKAAVSKKTAPVAAQAGTQTA